MSEMLFVFIAALSGSVLGNFLSVVIKAGLSVRKQVNISTVRKMATKVPVKVTVPDA